MAEWIKLEKKRFLTVEDMVAINNNFNYLREYYLSFGLPVGEMLDVSVTHNILPSAILQKFNDVEKNIQTIQKISIGYLDIRNKFFKFHTWKKYPVNLQKEVNRWFDFLNEQKRYFLQYGNLTDKYGELITDVNDESIQVLETFKEE